MKRFRPVTGSLLVMPSANRQVFRAIIVCALLVFSASGCKQKGEASANISPPRSFRKWIDGVPLPELTSIRPIHAVVVAKTVKEIPLDADMQAKLRIAEPTLWVAQVTLKRPDGTLFCITEDNAGVVERQFFSLLVVGNTYSLPDDFVALLEKVRINTQPRTVK